MDPADELLDKKQAAAFLRISDRTLDRIPDLPRLKIGLRRVVFRKADIERYIASRVEIKA